jgi:hypothetical protein
LLEEGGNGVANIGRVANEEVPAGRVYNQLGATNVRRSVFRRRLRMEEVVAAGDNQRGASMRSSGQTSTR